MCDISSKTITIDRWCQRGVLQRTDWPHQRWRHLCCKRGDLKELSCKDWSNASKTTTSMLQENVTKKCPARTGWMSQRRWHPCWKRRRRLWRHAGLGHTWRGQKEDVLGKDHGTRPSRPYVTLTRGNRSDMTLTTESRHWKRSWNTGEFGQDMWHLTTGHPENGLWELYAEAGRVGQ